MASTRISALDELTALNTDTVVAVDGSDGTKSFNLSAFQENIVSLTLQKLADQFYPVGSIYVTVSEEDPKVLLNMPTSHWTCLSSHAEPVALMQVPTDEGDASLLMQAPNNALLSTFVASGLPLPEIEISNLSVCEISGHTHTFSLDAYSRVATTERSSAGAGWAAVPYTYTGNSDLSGQHTHNLSGDITVESGDIYGKSDIVQPPAFYVNIWVRDS